MNQQVKTKEKNETHVTDHLANERTFLAWIRTGLGIIVLGFVIERFSIFIKRMAFYLSCNPKLDQNHAIFMLTRHESLFGVLLVILGVLLCIFAFFKFKKIEKQINAGTYYSSMWLDIILTLSVIVIGIFLIIYLIQGSA